MTRRAIGRNSLADLLLLHNRALADASGRLAVCRPRAADESTKRQIDSIRRQIAKTQVALTRYMVNADPDYLRAYEITPARRQLVQTEIELGQLLNRSVEFNDTESVVGYGKSLLRGSRRLMSSLPGDPTGEPEIG